MIRSLPEEGERGRGGEGGTRGQGDKETRGQGDKETRGQGEGERELVEFKACFVVLFLLFCA